MKNNKIIVVVTVMICVSILCGIYIFYNNPLDENIKNKDWYSYNIKTGTYDIFKIGDSSFTLLSTNNDYDNCTVYKYNTKKKLFTLNCGKNIYYKKYENNYLVLKIDNKEKVFFNSTDESLNYEFESYYEKSILEYKEEKSQIKEVIKIDYNKFNELYESNEKSIIAFMGDNCNNIDCVLFLGMLEKWNVDSNNVYYFDSSSLTSSELNNINNIINDEDNVLDFDNSNYAYVLVISNNQIKILKFKCSGFDCTSWKNFAKN